MPNTNYKDVAKRFLVDAVHNQFKDAIHKEWHPTDEQIQGVIKAQARNNMPLHSLLDECYRIDEKTKNLIDSGFSVFNGKAYFKNQEDALDYINDAGHNFDNWGEVRWAVHERKIDNCHYAEWSK